jgi:hypothetical protein
VVAAEAASSAAAGPLAAGAGGGGLGRINVVTRFLGFSVSTSAIVASFFLFVCLLIHLLFLFLLPAV